MESIRQYAKGNAVRDRGKGVSIVRRKREKCDRCSSFLTDWGDDWVITSITWDNLRCRRI